MSSGKKFSDCIYCIHYKSPITEFPCNECECDEEKLFAGRPSKFIEFARNPAYSEMEYKSLKHLLREYYGKPMPKEDKE